jgi:hypothetical protein
MSSRRTGEAGFTVASEPPRAAVERQLRGRRSSQREHVRGAVVEDHASSDAAARWAADLGKYLHDQIAPKYLVHRPLGTHPWPSTSNPMLWYLIDRAHELARSDVYTAIVWVAVHAWFEGAMDDKSRALALLSGKDDAAVRRHAEP